MIVGGGTIGYYLAKQLLKNGVRVRIVENSLERCEASAACCRERPLSMETARTAIF